jgi:hypothetical protein
MDQGIPHFIQLEWFDNGFDLFHGAAAKNASDANQVCRFSRVISRVNATGGGNTLPARKIIPKRLSEPPKQTEPLSQTKQHGQKKPARTKERWFQKKGFRGRGGRPQRRSLKAGEWKALENILGFAYKNPMSNLTEIERAADALPLEQQENLFAWLAERMRRRHLNSASPHSVLEIPPVSLGRVIRPLKPDDDLLGEMLEGRQ